MRRFKASLLAACGLLILAAVRGAIGPKRALAALGFTPVRDVDGAARQPFTVEGVVNGFFFKAFSGPGTNKRLMITAVTAIAGDARDEDIDVVAFSGGF